MSTFENRPAASGNYIPDATRMPESRLGERMQIFRRCLALMDIIAQSAKVAKLTDQECKATLRTMLRIWKLSASAAQDADISLAILDEELRKQRH
jgi:hypothetical protein